jgi:hypothetical protein
VALPVYSTVFFAASGTSVAENYTVPDGKTAVIRDFDGYFQGEDEGGQAVLTDQTNGVYIFIQYQTSGDQSFSWRGRQVFEEGTVIGMYLTSSEAANGRLSGYLLTN